NFGALLQLLFKGSFKKMVYRIRVIKGKRPDPFDSYGWMDQLHEQFNLHPAYFFLVAKEKGKHDRNIDVTNAEYQQLVHYISSKYAIGLHPSWASGDMPSLLTKEKDTLEQISNQTITSSRQHYIRFELPSTYRKLLALGITNDYSMGYGSINGFRASIATPFYWYDLKNEEKTQLLIHPFCFMDANSYYEQKLSPEAALEELMRYYDVVKSVNGTMITIWHNNFLGTADEFTGWKEAYEKSVSSIVKVES
ncbi:MAG TPA: polysaccharide deacetylase family protein, partial [Flavisolibacter sp.]|nr:polysaccharide deacetylase family protein [Flavisolibacter sp.]